MPVSTRLRKSVNKLLHQALILDGEVTMLADHAETMEGFIVRAYNAKDDHELGSIIHEAHCYIEESKREEEVTG